jgi:hypothetical protein
MRKGKLICIATPNNDQVILHYEDRTVVRHVPLLVFAPPPRRMREDILVHYIRYGYSYSERRKRRINTPLPIPKCYNYIQTFEKMVESLQTFFNTHQSEFN